MTNQPTTCSFNLPDGRTVTLETGKLARQADGSVCVRMGNTMLLATVVSNKEPKAGLDYFPLSVDYREKFSATGRFPGGFFKREARPSEHETLVSRLVDRALRPLFPDDYMNETQILVTLFSAGKNDIPDALACLAASSALTISDIPFKGPVSEVRVARVNGQLVINPGITESIDADIDLIVAAGDKNIVMVEGELKEVSEKDMIAAIALAHEAIRVQCRAQVELASKVEKSKVKRDYVRHPEDLPLKEKMYSELKQSAYDEVKSHTKNKHLRKANFDSILAKFNESLTEEEKTTKKELIKRYFEDIKYDVSRQYVLDSGYRMDGRKTDEIRNIQCEVNGIPGAHGDALFTRGETQALATVTLGTKLDVQTIDTATHQGEETFLLHYNFPPFSTGEVKPQRAISRREVGHGNLALRALTPMIPPPDINPYTIRIVSDILESNGSSSMATVCAGSLALMDAGVKIPRHVSGIAMGLITDDKGRYAVLSDILGDEDHLGDMDFKVTGTENGITACQMDIKIDGLSFEVMSEALEQARKGRLHILTHLYTAIEQPRADYKPHAPRIVQIRIDKEMIGAVIGPGGKMIKQLQEETETVIMIEEADGVGIVEIASENKTAIEAALARIKAITTVPVVGETYKGKVVSVREFGAIIEFMPGKEGLLHISEIAWERIDKTEDKVKEGEMIEVKLIDRDPTGKCRLSRKALIPSPSGEEYVYQPPRSSGSGGKGGSRFGSRDRDSRGGNGRFGHSSSRDRR